MKLPRDLSGDDLVSALAAFGYRLIRQSGSHMRIVTQEHGEHHVTIPRRPALRVGTLAGILGDVADHFGLRRDEVLSRLFGEP